MTPPFPEIAILHRHNGAKFLPRGLNSGRLLLGKPGSIKTAPYLGLPSQKKRRSPCREESLEKSGTFLPIQGVYLPTVLEELGVRSGGH
jgi:hypothetical protein